MKDRRVRILDPLENQSVRYDVYDYRSGSEFIVRDMSGLENTSRGEWLMAHRVGEITSFFIPKKTGIPQAINPAKSKNKKRSNPAIDAWRYYALKLMKWEARRGN